jgi:hypothetical protein
MAYADGLLKTGRARRARTLGSIAQPDFAANNWHQPFGLIVPSTTRHEAGGMKFRQPEQRCPFLG